LAATGGLMVSLYKPAPAGAAKPATPSNQTTPR
ncbi:MAG: hypothetical protein ACJAUC_005052, partial [Planctomycetota bacterium]